MLFLQQHAQQLSHPCYLTVKWAQQQTIAKIEGKELKEKFETSVKVFPLPLINESGKKRYEDCIVSNYQRIGSSKESVKVKNHYSFNCRSWGQATKTGLTVG